jgi:hypothetical protein
MAFEDSVKRAFGLEGDAWLRHANPWSVYTRIPIPALLVAAVWTRQWLGGWCLVPVAVVVLWTFVNPRAFPPPKSLDHWASRSVLGERFWGEPASVRSRPTTGARRGCSPESTSRECLSSCGVSSSTTCG